MCYPMQFYWEKEIKKLHVKFLYETDMPISKETRQKRHLLCVRKKAATLSSAPGFIFVKLVSWRML